jgi:hypothetical protein
MPAKDLYHETVKHALEKDGWTITHDPLTLRWGRKDYFVDIGAEQLLTASKADRKIAVEVKSFIGRSEAEDLEKALGQFILYQDIMAEIDPDRELFLAVRRTTFYESFEEGVGRLMIEKKRVRIIVFDDDQEEILQWLT